MESHIERAEHVILDFLNESRGIPRRTTRCCIYRIPPSLRRNSEHSFTPLMVSIGPLHHGVGDLGEMERKKYLFMDSFHKSLTSDEEKREFEEFAKWLDEEEGNIKECYSEKLTNFDRTKFLGMMMLDSIFIMELFLRKMDLIPEDDDNLFLNPMYETTIVRDLILTENQLPFYLLVILFDRVVPDRRKHGCSNFLELARHFFKSYDPYHAKELLVSDWNDPVHFTDLLRSFNISGCLRNDRDSTPTPALMTVKKLKELGVSFEPVSDICLFSMSFEKHFKACLKIPTVVFNWSTESLLYNLIAFELCHDSGHLFVCSYISLLTSLIHTKEDVEILKKRKVIIAETGSDEDIAKKISSLSQNIVTTKYTGHLLLTKTVNDHCDRWSTKIFAKLSTLYFSHVWQGIGTILFIMLLFFSIVRFIRAM